MLSVTLGNLVQASALCKLPISKENPATFTLVSSLKSQSETKGFHVTIYDVPLDIGKQVFKLFLEKSYGH